MDEIITYGLIALVVIGGIVYFIWGWSGIAVSVLIVALIFVISGIRKRNKKQKELEELRMRQLQEKKKADEELRKVEELRARQEADRLAREQESKNWAEKRKAYLEAQQKAFVDELEAIPSAQIGLSADEYKRRALSGMPEIKFTNITKRTNPLTFTSFVVVDVETTGIPRTSKIIELSAIRFEGFAPVEKFSTMIDPECAIPVEASKVNGITNDMVSGSPKIWEVMPAFQKFVGSTPVVGHNLAFDLEFLYANGFNFDNPKQRFYDTLQLAKSVLARANYDYSNNYDVDDYKLGTICEHYKIYIGNVHRAGSDCLATGKIFEKLAHAKMQ